MKLTAVTAGLALLLSATGAQATSLFDVFRVVCLNHNADPKMAISEAEAVGWPKADQRLIRVLTAPSEKGEIIAGAAGRGKSDLRGTLAVVVAQTSRMIPRQEIPAQACVVVAGPNIDAKAVEADVAAYAGVPGRLGLAFQKNAMGWLWNEIDGKRTPLAPEDIVASRQAGDVKMLIVMTFKDSSVLELFVPVKERF